MSWHFEIDQSHQNLVPYGLAVFRKVVPISLCRSIVDGIEKSENWQPLNFGAYENGKLVRLTEDEDIHGLVNYQYDFPENFEDELKKFVQEFSYLTWKLTAEGFSRFTASKLQTGMRLGSHRDSRYADTPRIISAVVYLNDKFIGGNIEFPKLNVSLTPQVGDMFLFFSEHEHQVTEVISGNRVSGVFFLENSPIA